MNPSGIQRDATAPVDHLVAAEHAAGACGATRAWRVLAGACIVLAAILVPWLSVGDHALYPPDEGRYAAASRTMAEGGSWLVPTRDGRPHLTKPPVTYWLQAAAIRLLGPTSLAPRLPSLLAGGAVTLMVLLVGWRMLGPRGGVVAAALMGTMPLPLVVQRLAITDSLLAACWLAALVGGGMAAQTGARRWAALLWAATAAGLMVKGPVALIPVAVLVSWLLLGRRARDLGRLHLAAGVPLAVVPVVAWAALVALLHPAAVDIWRHEVLDRAIGEGDHNEPFWFFIPVLLVGCFPATAMLTLPVFNTSWRASWAHLRSGSIAALVTFAILVPLLILSLNRGKLPTYALPMAAPLALVAAMVLERWLSGDAVAPSVRRAPDVRWTIGLILLLTGPAAFIAGRAFLPEAGPLPAILLLPTAAGLVAIAVWGRGPRWREWSLAGLFACWMAAVAAGVEIEDLVRSRTDPRRLLSEAAQIADEASGPLVMYGLRDGTLDYYSAPTRRVEVVDDPFDGDRPRPASVLLAEERAWREYASQWPERAEQYDLRTIVSLWPRRRVLLLEPSARREARAVGRNG